MLVAYGAERESIFLKGNHEAVAVRCLSDRSWIEGWIKLGGYETLASYGVAVKNISRTAEIQLAFHNALPQNHIKFFRELRSFFACGDYFFAHAGVRPGVALNLQSEDDLIWIRDQFLYSDFEFEKIIVHGHSPVDRIDFRRNRINIDTGAYATNRLTCLIIETNEMWTFDTTSPINGTSYL
jgi:serine/threonine protein phosphatase 1